MVPYKNNQSIKQSIPSHLEHQQSLWQPSNRISSVIMATLSQTECHQSIWQPPVKQNVISHYGNPQSNRTGSLQTMWTFKISTDPKISTNRRKWYSRITLIISENDTIKSSSTKCDRANGALHLFFQICHQQKTGNPLLETKSDTTAIHFQNHTEIQSTCFILHCGLLYTALWTASYCTVDCFILHCRLLNTVLWTVDCFILHCRLLNTVLWTALYCTVDYFILHCGRFILHCGLLHT